MLNRLINISKSSSFFLFGARGTGKSTLMKKSFAPSLGDASRYIYIDLLKATEREQLEIDPDSLENRILSDTQWIIIDEVQKIPPLLDTVHRLIEDRGLKFALTGSSAKKLRAGGANLLAGRAFVYELFPLTCTELGDRFNLIEVLSWGSLPKLYTLTNIEDKKLFLESYARTYLREEIWDEHLVRNLNPFRRFLQVAAQANGTVLNYTKIAKDVGIDTKTAQQYFGILEDTLLGFLLEPYSHSPRKRLRQNPKFYLFDVGVTRALTRDFALEFSEQSYGFGYRFEHYLIAEIIRLHSYAQAGFEFSFIRTKDDREVDLVIDRPGKELALIEIKSSKNIVESHVSNLYYFSKHFPTAELFCLSRDPIRKQFEKIKAMHWQEGLQELGFERISE